MRSHVRTMGVVVYGDGTVNVKLCTGNTSIILRTEKKDIVTFGFIISKILVARDNSYSVLQVTVKIF